MACCINFAVVCVISSWRLCCLYVAVWVIYFIFVCVNSLLMLVFFCGFFNHFLCDLRGCLVGLFACFFVTSSSLLCLYFSFCVVLLPWLCGLLFPFFISLPLCFCLGYFFSCFCLFGFFWICLVTFPLLYNYVPFWVLLALGNKCLHMFIAYWLHCYRMFTVS